MTQDRNITAEVVHFGYFRWVNFNAGRYFALCSAFVWQRWTVTECEQEVTCTDCAAALKRIRQQ